MAGGRSGVDGNYWERRRKEEEGTRGDGDWEKWPEPSPLVSNKRRTNRHMGKKCDLLCGIGSMTMGPGPGGQDAKGRPSGQATYWETYQGVTCEWAWDPRGHIAVTRAVTPLSATCAPKKLTGISAEQKSWPEAGGRKDETVGRLDQTCVRSEAPFRSSGALKARSMSRIRGLDVDCPLAGAPHKREGTKTWTHLQDRTSPGEGPGATVDTLRMGYP